MPPCRIGGTIPRWRCGLAFTNLSLILLSTPRVSSLRFNLAERLPLELCWGWWGAPGRARQPRIRERNGQSACRPSRQRRLTPLEETGSSDTTARPSSRDPERRPRSRRSSSGSWDGRSAPDLLLRKCDEPSVLSDLARQRGRCGIPRLSMHFLQTAPRGPPMMFFPCTVMTTR